MSNRRNKTYIPRHAVLRDASTTGQQDIQSWQDDYIALATFVTEKGRMPTHSDSGETYQLWAWANRQNTALMFGVLNQEQTDALQAIPNFRKSFSGK